MRGFPSGAVVKNLSANAGDTTDTQFVGGDPLEDDMAPPLQYSCRESHGQRSLAGYCPWGCKELDTTEVT